jgi:hypothetical protein
MADLGPNDDDGGGLLSWAAAVKAEERDNLFPRQDEVGEHMVAHTGEDGEHIEAHADKVGEHVVAHASEVGGHTVAHAEREESESSQVLGSSEEREDVMDTTSARGSPQLLVLELAAKLAEIAAPEEELVDNRGHDALASSEERSATATSFL